MLRKRVDDPGAKPGLRLGENAVRFPNPVIGDRKLPIGSGHFVGDCDPAFFCLCIESVLKLVYH